MVLSGMKDPNFKRWETQLRRTAELRARSDSGDRFAMIIANILASDARSASSRLFHQPCPSNHLNLSGQESDHDD